MHLQLISNPDDRSKEKYEIARAIYAETGATSLRLVEAFASMIYNAAMVNNCAPIDVVRDCKKFQSRDIASPLHVRWNVSANSPAFQMCLRVTQKMLNGTLGDLCCGATRFHHDNNIPAWATSLGYVADIDGVLFYS